MRFGKYTNLPIRLKATDWKEITSEEYFKIWNEDLIVYFVNTIPYKEMYTSSGDEEKELVRCIVTKGRYNDKFEYKYFKATEWDTEDE